MYQIYMQLFIPVELTHSAGRGVSRFSRRERPRQVWRERERYHRYVCIYIYIYTHMKSTSFERLVETLGRAFFRTWATLAVSMAFQSCVLRRKQ